MRPSIVTLLTDFGTKDHYVAAMKGMILRVNPDCALVDITHHVPPHEIEEGAFILANACGSFPKGTIHLAVVDPGVGSPRRPILMVTTNYLFVGPDNGLFSFVLRREKVKKAFVLTNRKFFSPRISSTFHGRDIFGPVCGYLSLGVDPKDFGCETDSWQEIDFPEPRMERATLLGEIVHVDAFGNLVTNIEEEILLRFTKKQPFQIRIGESFITGLKKGYWEEKGNKPIALIGSGGFLEISVRERSAQKALKVKKGDAIKVTRIS